MEKAYPGGKGNTTYTPGDIDSITETDAKTMRKIKRILVKGNNAEVRMKSDGTLTVYEVRKSIV